MGKQKRTSLKKMDISKISGLIYISAGKITIDSLRDNEVEIKDSIQKLLTLKNIIDESLINFEKDFQKQFLNMPKIPNQWDLEDMINSVESEKKIDGD